MEIRAVTLVCPEVLSNRIPHAGRNLILPESQVVLFAKTVGAVLKG